MRSVDCLLDRGVVPLGRRGGRECNFPHFLHFTPPPKVKKKDAKKINSQKCIPPDLITNRFKDIGEAIGATGQRC
jgi:hypothetical protein